MTTGMWKRPLVPLSLVVLGYATTAPTTTAFHQALNTRQVPLRQSSWRYRKQTFILSMASTSSRIASTSGSNKKSAPKPVFLTHERDFFRQMARLESMDGYVLVSTLTASMSFGALLGFTPSHTDLSKFSVAGKVAYDLLCLAIQGVSSLSTICGIYATLIFSLTILYSKSALGSERDIQYDKFLTRTAKARVRGFRSFSWSLALFTVEAFLVLVERVYCHRLSLPFIVVAATILRYAYVDWHQLYKSANIIYQD